ncbi:MAG: 4-(cytidine 5'-diphospho)-2-C-methyl-D-erythritol kinase [Bacteroidetes bacterium]|nr:4-(cytidine 5'-diphospho)-2-C-methyl-D-erythritol kinase [Bacteroidota bacterium]
MTIRSFAKINLGLRVLGRRADGFHDISTIFHRVELHDTLHLETTDGKVTLECNRDDIPVDDGNLCVRAARLLLAQQRGRGVHIVLQKNIPAGAGLGGGSSNAAAVLRFLPKLLGQHIPDGELLEMAALLGSDVPFFLQDGSAAARGRGERLTYFVWNCPWWIVLVNPGIHVSTAWAYGALRLEAQPEDPDLQALLERAVRDPEALATLLRNDFEAPVMEAHPGIREVKEAMLRAGAVGAMMSGSGSSVFGLFDNEAAARTCAAGFPPGQLLGVTPPDFSPVLLQRNT